MYCLNETMQDPSIGPAQWYDRVKRLHENHIKTYQNLANCQIRILPKELNKLSDSYVMSEYLFRQLFIYLYCKIIKPLRQKWRIWVARMGGTCISTDMTYSIFDKLYGHCDYKRMTQNIDIHGNVDPTLDGTLDKRTTQRHMQVGILTIQNQYHFSFDEVMVPYASEQHCYLAPEIAIFLGWICKYSEKRIESMNIKHDGLTSGRKLDVKVGYCASKIFGKTITNEYTGQVFEMDKFTHQISVKNIFIFFLKRILKYFSNLNYADIM